MTDKLIADLRNMYESVLVNADIDKRAEVDDVSHRTAEFHTGSQVLNVENVRSQNGSGKLVAGIAPRLF